MTNRRSGQGFFLHLASEADWAAAQASGRYANESFRRDGIVYCCLPSQLRLVVEAHFPRPDGWLVLELAPDHLDGEVRWIPFSDGRRTEIFPHLHGTFDVTAVQSAEPLASRLAL
jgi:uncharacterized protein (DUF952 family)